MPSKSNNTAAKVMRYVRWRRVFQSGQLPDPLNSVVVKGRITTQDSPFFAQRLRYEQAVKRIPMMPRQFGNHRAMSGLEVEAMDAIAGHFLRNPLFPTRTEPKIRPIETQLDANFPKRCRAPSQILGCNNRAPRAGRQPNIIRDHPQQGMGI